MKVKEAERKLFPSLLLLSLTCLGLVGGKETLPPSSMFFAHAFAPTQFAQYEIQ